MNGRTYRILDSSDGWVGCHRDEPSTAFDIHTSAFTWQECWNGNPVIPPVGIKAEQCSHSWQVRKEFEQPGLSVDDCYTCVLELVPR